MRARPRHSRRQGMLFHGADGSDDRTMVDAKPELIEALADLLLEALGDECSEEGDDRERQDHH